MALPPWLADTHQTGVFVQVCKVLCTEAPVLSARRCLNVQQLQQLNACVSAAVQMSEVHPVWGQLLEFIEEVVEAPRTQA